MSTVFSRISNDIKTGTSTRFELVGFVVSLFAFLSHCCFLLLFYFLKIWPMFYFNIVSVSFFSILFFTFRKTHSYLPHYISSAIEVIIHQACADYFLGVQTGFHYYIILIALIASLELEHHVKLSAIFAAIAGACFLAIEVGMMNLTPVYQLPELTVRIIKTANISFTLIIIVIIEYVFNETVIKAEQTAMQQYTRAEKLLTNILPVHIVNKLKNSNYSGTIADSYDSVAVLFLDIADFTQFSSQLEAKAILTILNSLFSQFDEVLDQYHIEKIKTTSDSYIAAAGIPDADKNSYTNMARFALKMQQIVDSFNEVHHTSFKVRVGVHCGPVVAGVIGKKKFVYDLWGSTVNIAAQMEITCIPGRIQVSKEFFDKLNKEFVFEERAPIPIRGYGMRTNYYLVSPRSR